MTERFDPDETAPLDPAVEAADFEPRGWAAQVNLLPADVLSEQRRRRVGIVAVAVLLVYLAGLGTLYVLKLGDVSEARADRDAVERDVVQLRAEAESLQEYATLSTRLEVRETLLTSAMEDELSWARIFGELALAFSRQASLTEVQAASANVDPADPAAAVAADDTVDPTAEPDPDDPVAEVIFTGYSVDRFAPGVEEVLSNFEDADGFLDSYLSLAADEERGNSMVTTFEGRVELDDAVYTHRFDDGLPEESLQ